KFVRRNHGKIRSIKVNGVSAQHNSQPVEIEMGVARAQWFPRPSNQFTSFGKRARSLGPFQPRAYAPILILSLHRHHVRVANNFLATAQAYDLVHKADQLALCKGSERPAAGFSRYDQM